MEREQYIQAFLEEIAEGRDRYAEAVALQAAVFGGKKPARQPLLLKGLVEDGTPAPYDHEVIHRDKEKMFYNELRAAVAATRGKAEAVPSVRASMGCGIFPTLLGVKQAIFPDKMPWVIEHLNKETLAAMDVGDIRLSDDFQMGLEHMAYMAERLEGTGCRVYPMDVQGAFDTAHIVYGDAIFYDLYDDPPFVHHLLQLSCEAIYRGMEAMLAIIPGADTTVAHYNALAIPRVLGGVKLSEDTATLLCEEHVQEYVAPYIAQIIDHFGGGYVHYCGRNPHLLDTVLSIPRVLGLNFGNPDMHDMPAVLRRCAEAGKVYTGALLTDLTNPRAQLEALYAASLTEDGRSILLLEAAGDPARLEPLKAAFEEVAGGA